MEGYFKSSELSDAIVKFVLVVEPDIKDEQAPKRARLADYEITRFPAHQLVLKSQSSVIRAEIEAGAAEVTVRLASEAEVAVADAMFASMYDVPNALQQLQQPDVLRLALLANKYDVPKALKAAVQQLTAQPLVAVTLDLMWQLPGCWEQPFWPLLKQAVEHKMASGTDDSSWYAAAEAVTNLLLYVCDRDLECVWTDSSSFRRDLLLRLDPPVLAAFLGSDALRMVSEDTVLYTVAKAIEKLSGQGHTRIAWATRQLLRAVRLPHLTPTALSCIAPKLPYIDPKSTSNAVSVKMLGPARVAWDLPRSWRLPQRGLSSKTQSPRTQHTILITAEAADLQTAARDVLNPTSPPAAVYVAVADISGSYFGGRQWDIYLWVRKVDAAAETGLFVRAVFPTPLGKSPALPWMRSGVTASCGNASNTTLYEDGPYGLDARCPVCSVDAALQQAVDGKVTFKVTLGQEHCR